MSRKIKYTLSLTLVFSLFLAPTVLGAILAQNFTQWDATVVTPPIDVLVGGDDGVTTHLDVTTGLTIATAFGTNLEHSTIAFSCMEGDRAYYTDVLTLDNPATADAETWNTLLRIEADVAGNPAVADTFAAGTADVWLLVSTVASPTETPNPNNLGTLTEWNTTAAQLDVTGGVLSVATAATGTTAIADGDSRQVALVVDCGTDMVATETGTFRVTVESTP